MKFGEFENKLLKRFFDNGNFLVITDSMIEEKARDIKNELELVPDVLKFSDDWLYKIKRGIMFIGKYAW